MDSWLTIKGHKRSLDDDLRKLIWLEPRLGDTPLADITAARLDDILAERKVSNATRNRYRALILSVLQRAQRLGWIAAVPHVERLEEPAKTPRFLTPDQANALLEALDTPRRRHLRDMVAFTLATGLRESNVTGLTWAQVDLGQGYAVIEAESAKGKRTLRVPLNSSALAILKARKGIHPRQVFSYRGKALRKANRDGFQEAKKEVGLPWLRWHDLRHTWASWHAQAGTPLRVLQELGGWADLSMVLRYAHLGPAHADQYAEKVAQNVTHFSNEEIEKAVND